MNHYTTVEYVWIDGSGQNLRSKAKTITSTIGSASDLPKWNFDGSSTNQAQGHDSEIILVPIRLFNDPFRTNGFLVMCECYNPEDNNGISTPTATNHRHMANQIFSALAAEQPWYGLEQEYVLMKNGRPLGWPSVEDPRPQGDYYCGVGTNNISGREIVEEHYRLCLEAGIKISGINAEVMLGQWEFQVGPCEGIEAGDSLWMARYILHRVCEKYGVTCNFHPKPVTGDWNGSGCHVNFSTNNMRATKTGYDVIVSAIEKLKENHLEHMEIYGTHNHERLTGKHETSSFSDFTWGVANRGASIRIGRETFENKGGYFEDRRPASNIDPYQVTAKILKTTCS